MKEPQLFPIKAHEEEFIDENERLHWLTFVIGFLIGCVATLGLILL